MLVFVNFMVVDEVMVVFLVVCIEWIVIVFVLCIGQDFKGSVYECVGRGINIKFVFYVCVLIFCFLVEVDDVYWLVVMGGDVGDLVFVGFEVVFFQKVFLVFNKVKLVGSEVAGRKVGIVVQFFFWDKGDLLVLNQFYLIFFVVFVIGFIQVQYFFCEVDVILI